MIRSGEEWKWSRVLKIEEFRDWDKRAGIIFKRSGSTALMLFGVMRTGRRW